MVSSKKALFLHSLQQIKVELENAPKVRILSNHILSFMTWSYYLPVPRPMTYVIIPSNPRNQIKPNAQKPHLKK